MRRRVIVSASGAAVLGAALPAFAQTQRVAHVGQLANRSPTDPANVPFQHLARDTLKQLGWEIGRNLVFTYKWGPTDLQHQIANARELVAAKVDVIWASNSEATAAAFQVTKTIPIVMVGEAAVEPGYAKSLARPGGNVTGFVYQTLDSIGKELELLLSLQPGLKRIGYSESLEVPAVALKFKYWQTIAAAKGVSVVLLPNVLAVADIEPMLVAAKRESVDALVLGGVRYVLVGEGLQRIQEWATANRMLTYSGNWHRGQLLAAFGLDGTQIVPTVCRQINRVLRGEKPAEIPIEQPTQFKLIINQKIARAIGLKIPNDILLQATTLID